MALHLLFHTAGLLFTAFFSPACVFKSILKCTFVFEATSGDFSGIADLLVHR